MNMNFYRKLPVPKEIKEQYPITPEMSALREKQLRELKDIFEDYGLTIAESSTGSILGRLIVNPAE